MEAAEIRKQVDALRVKSQGHKRAIRRHRQALQESSRKLAGLRDYCEAHGIALIIENPSEGRPHGSAGIKK